LAPLSVGGAIGRLAPLLVGAAIGRRHYREVGWRHYWSAGARYWSTPLLVGAIIERSVGATIGRLAPLLAGAIIGRRQMHAVSYKVRYSFS
jgi:hypothetical protein